MNRSLPVTRAILLAGWMVLMLACTPSSEGAALESKEIVPEIMIDGVPLLDSVRALARQADLNYIVDPHVPGSDFEPGKSAPRRNVTRTWSNITAHAALEDLLTENQLVLVTNPVTTVARIAPKARGIQPVLASQVRTNTNNIIPILAMDSVPLIDALKKLADTAKLTLDVDPLLTTPECNLRGVVTFRWERLTVRQALSALLDNYDLEMIEQPDSSTARIRLKPNAVLPKKPLP